MIRRFNRFELKFILDVAARDALLEELLGSMSYDAYAEGEAGYPVTSLYYDSPELSCFWSKLEGIKYRRKVRVRVYARHADDPTTPAMVEIKQRINRTVQKRRLVLPLSLAYGLCNGSEHPEPEDPRDAAVASEIAFLRDAMQLAPACVVTYQRQALVGTVYDPGLRVTFDSLLRYRHPGHLLGSASADKFFMSPKKGILEVKVDDAVPLWLAHMLARHGCNLQRISKYCEGVARLRDFPHPSVLALARRDHG